MYIKKLTRDEYITSISKLTNEKNFDFANEALNWWDNFFSWKKFPPFVLNDGEKDVCYLFFNVSKNNQYLTIHNLLTPTPYRGNGYAYKLLQYMFKELCGKGIQRFKFYCVFSSLNFYNTLGLKYWGVNDLGQYLCNFKMPKYGIEEIETIVNNCSLSELTDIEITKIYEKHKNNGSTLSSKYYDIHLKCVNDLEEKYMFNSLEKKMESINEKNS